MKTLRALAAVGVAAAAFAGTAAVAASTPTNANSAAIQRGVAFETETNRQIADCAGVSADAVGGGSVSELTAAKATMSANDQLRTYGYGVTWRDPADDRAASGSDDDGAIAKCTLAVVTERGAPDSGVAKAAAAAQPAAETVNRWASCMADGGYKVTTLDDGPLMVQRAYSTAQRETLEAGKATNADEARALQARADAAGYQAASTLEKAIAGTDAACRDQAGIGV